MSKFYAVKCEQNKIFTTWDECKAYLEEVKNYKYKSFSTLEEANAYLEDRDYYAEILNKDLSEGFAVAFSDGSYEDSVGKYSFGVVTVSPEGTERQFSGRGENPEFLPSRNIAGEVDGVLTAVRWAFLNGYKKIKIYHDYEGLSAWALGRWKGESPIAVYYLKEFAKYKGVVDVVFVKVKGHSNHKYNEIVDKLAKEALFDGKIQPLFGFGYKVSSYYFFDDMIKWLNAKAPKAIIKERLDGFTFTFGEEMLAVYPRFTATSVVGTGGGLYALALSYFLQNHKEMPINQLIERCFGVEVDKNITLDGFEISKLAIGFLKENFAPSIIFSLDELELALKTALSANDKISTYFQKTESGFVLKDGKSDERLQTAYEFFFKQRANYLNLNYNEAQALEVIEKAKELVARIKGGTYGY